MTESWDAIFNEVKNHKDDGKNYFPAAVRMVEYLDRAPIEKMVAALQEVLNFFGAAPYDRDDPVQVNIATALGYVLLEIAPERQILFVRIGLRWLAEDLDCSSSPRDGSGNPVSRCRYLWYIFCANTSLFKNPIQARQWRMLAKKLVATHPAYRDDFFLTDRLLVSKNMRLNSLERKKWFWKKNPKWLTS